MVTINITKEQLRIFLQTIKSLSFGECDACGQLAYLVKHHWYDQDDIVTWFANNRQGDLKVYHKKTCGSCNNWLTRTNIKEFAKKRHYKFIDKFKSGYYLTDIKGQKGWIWSHILPPWDIQKEFAPLAQKQYLNDNDFAPLGQNPLINGDIAKQVFTELRNVAEQ